MKVYQNFWFVDRPFQPLGDFLVVEQLLPVCPNILDHPMHEQLQVQSSQMRKKEEFMNQAKHIKPFIAHFVQQLNINRFFF